jgi:hypothetical protein
MRRTSSGVAQYGGINTTTFPTGRVKTPRRAIASQTRIPARARSSNGSRVRQSRTSSTLTTDPTLPDVPDRLQVPERLQALPQ